MTATAFAQRLHALATHRGGQATLSAASGIPKTTLAKYVSGESEPNVSRLIALARAGGVSVEWLACGDEMPMSPSPHGVAESAGSPYALGAGGADAPGRAGAGFAVIPPLGETVAGTGESDQPGLPLPRAWLDERGLAVARMRWTAMRGNAMAPTLHAGDILVVDACVDAAGDDGIYVLRDATGLHPRRLQADGCGGLWLITDAPLYHDRHLAGSDLTTLSIAGRAVWVAQAM